MPNRILKESICTSDNIDQLSAFQETFFYRLIVNCDDYGRMDARPKILASRLYPLKDIRAAQIEDALRALTSAELVTLYSVHGKPFLQMNTWNLHQRMRDSKAKYPSIEEADAESRGELPQVAASCSKMLLESNPIQSEYESESNTNICAAASAAQVATLTLLDGSSFVITEDDAEKDQKAYPAIDVISEYQKMSRWLDANQKNRKTRSGIKRFINSWLSRAQNSARASSGTKTKTVSAQQYTQRAYTEDELRAVSGSDLLDEARKLIS